MNSRERVIKALRREVPDRVPKFFTITPALEQLFVEKTGKPYSTYEEYFNLDVRMVHLMNHPVRKADFIKFHPDYSKDMKLDEWGIGYVKGSMFHFERLYHPMKTFERVEQVLDYPFPDLSTDYIFDGYREKVSQVKEGGHAAVGIAAPVGGTVFWPAYKMRGMEELFMDMYENPEMLECLLEKVTDITCRIARRTALAGVDILWMADDFGTQQDLMMSVDMWRKWFKERLYRVIHSAKEVNPDIIIAFHSDGNIQKIIPDMIEIGIEVLNPIQPECMDPAEIKQKYGNKLAFWGGLGTQTTMPFGTPKDVKATIKELIQNVGRGGGLLLAPTHVLEPEVPWENIVAFIDAVEEYGSY